MKVSAEPSDLLGSLTSARNWLSLKYIRENPNGQFLNAPCWKSKMMKISDCIKEESLLKGIHCK